MAKIVIIGGGVIGSSIAYHLAMAGHAADVVVVEPDPTYTPALDLRQKDGAVGVDDGTFRESQIRCDRAHSGQVEGCHRL